MTRRRGRAGWKTAFVSWRLDLALGFVFVFLTFPLAAVSGMAIGEAIVPQPSEFSGWSDALPSLAAHSAGMVVAVSIVTALYIAVMYANVTRCALHKFREMPWCLTCDYPIPLGLESGAAQVCPECGEPIARQIAQMAAECGTARGRQASDGF